MDSTTFITRDRLDNGYLHNICRLERGRNGTSATRDGSFSVDLAVPKELDGSGEGANPEQLFAAGYAACFDSALDLVAEQQELGLESSETTVEVSLNPTDDGGFALDVDISVEVEGIDEDTAQDLVARAHQVCPYSNVVRGNIEIEPTAKVK